MNYIKHGPKDLDKVVDTVADFLTFVTALSAIDKTDGNTWEFAVVQMTEKEFNDLPDFEGF